MSDLLIRQATEHDLQAIVDMLADDELGATRESRDVLAPYRQAFAEVTANPNQLLVVAEYDHRIVGTAQVTFMAGLSHKGMWRADIEAIRIQSDERGSGLGTILMQWCIQEARDRGCGMAQLTSNASRVAAHRFYERLGFSQSHLGFKLKL